VSQDHQGIGRRPARFYSVAAVADILGTSEVTLYRAIRAGEFPAIKIRGRYVIPSRALDAMEDTAVTTGSVVDPADRAAAGGVA
jgi:excisionase family DNA binding protein